MNDLRIFLLTYPGMYHPYFRVVVATDETSARELAANDAYGKSQLGSDMWLVASCEPIGFPLPGVTVPQVISN